MEINKILEGFIPSKHLESNEDLITWNESILSDEVQLYILKTSNLREALNGTAYWSRIGPNGVEVYEVSGETHIKTILDNPELFGLTLEAIQAKFEEFGEPINFEGKAREEIIKTVAQNGWIRIRHYTGRNDYWSIQTDDTNKRQKALKAFVRWATTNSDEGKPPMSYDDTVIIMGYNDPNDIKRFDFMTGGVKRYLVEGGRSALKRDLLGASPKVFSLTILTAENPNGEKLSLANNKKSLSALKTTLKKGKIHYTQEIGQYFNKEAPLFIRNLDLNGAKHLSAVHLQQSFIYGRRPTPDSSGFVFEYWSTPWVDKRDHDKGNVKATGRPGQYVKLDQSSIIENKQDAEDYFSRIGDWKFSIPFSIFDGEQGLDYEETESEDFVPIDIEKKEMLEKYNRMNKRLAYNDRSTRNHWDRLAGIAQMNYLARNA